MIAKSVSCLALGLLAVACGAADAGNHPEAEATGEQFAPLIIVGDCTFSDSYANKCSQKGGYLTCDGGTSMCCKDSTNSKGDWVSTLCAANVDEIRQVSPPPVFTVVPIEPGPHVVK